jgi:hypothetical protein
MKTTTENEVGASHAREGVGGSMAAAKRWLFTLMLLLILSTMAAQYVVYQRMLEAYASIDQLKVEAASLRLHLERSEGWKGRP